MGRRTAPQPEAKAPKGVRHLHAQERFNRGQEVGSRPQQEAWEKRPSRPSWRSQSGGKGGLAAPTIPQEEGRSRGERKEEARPTWPRPEGDRPRSLEGEESSWCPKELLQEGAHSFQESKAAR